MGSIALLRQTYWNAQLYKGQPVHEGTNLSLQAWLDEQSFRRSSTQVTSGTISAQTGSVMSSAFSILSRQRQRIPAHT